MLQIKKTRINQDKVIVLITGFVLMIGVALVVLSALNSSSFLAILGVAIIFWGAILLYVTPFKHVPLTLLNASAEAAADNIERLISELNLNEKGVYLPPKNLKNIDSSLVFIPKTPLPTPEEADEKLFTNQKTGAFVTPPGSALSRLFEEELGFSFTKTNLEQIQNKLPKLLVEGMELAEEAEIQIQSKNITLEITGSILDEICRKTDSQPRTHKQVGCLLSSAIACALAKAAGKPVTIQNETRNQETKTTHIEYQIFEYEIFEGETMQLPPLTVLDVRLNDGEVQSSVSGDSGLNILGIEIDPNALNYLKKNGDVFILTDVEISQYLSYKIKGYDADAKLIIKFVEFAEVCKTYHDSQTDINNPRTEFTTKIFDVTSPADLKHYDLAFYVAKSGFSTVDDWVKTLKTDEIPECSTGHNKLFYIYHIQRAPRYQILEG